MEYRSKLAAARAEVDRPAAAADQPFGAYLDVESVVRALRRSDFCIRRGSSVRICALSDPEPGHQVMGSYPCWTPVLGALSSGAAP